MNFDNIITWLKTLTHAQMREIAAQTNGAVSFGCMQKIRTGERVNPKLSTILVLQEQFKKRKK